jgi:hypothetical protein
VRLDGPDPFDTPDYTCEAVFVTLLVLLILVYLKGLFQ